MKFLFKIRIYFFKKNCKLLQLNAMKKLGCKGNGRINEEFAVILFLSWKTIDKLAI